MERSSSSAPGVFRSTVRAYLQPLVYARSFVGRFLLEIFPSAGKTGVNVFCGVLLLAVCFGAGMFAHVQVAARHPVAEIYRTAAGEVRVARLSDGSSVHLAPQSQISVEFSEDLRRVALEGGEAYFDVAHDEAKPFVVRTGDNVVRVLGTRFDVRALPNDELTVTVSAGVVAVFRQPNAGRTEVPRGALRLVAGQVAHVKSDGVSIRTLSQPEIDKKLAWREGRYTFGGENLATLIEDLNRLSTRQFVIEDRSIENVMIGGTISLDEPEVILEILRDSGVRHVLVDHDGTKVIVLYAASNAEEPHGPPRPR